MPISSKLGKFAALNSVVVFCPSVQMYHYNFVAVLDFSDLPLLRAIPLT